MAFGKLASLGRHRTLVVITLLQGACAIGFAFDIATEFDEVTRLHRNLESLAVLALWLGTFLGVREIGRLLAKNHAMEARLRTVSGAFQEILEESFVLWGLTPSERDVAMLVLKGLSIAEIATLRETRQGTVKAQCAAVYRKAGVGSRSQLLSYFVDDLMSGVALDRPPADGALRRAGGARAAAAAPTVAE